MEVLWSLVWCLYVVVFVILLLSATVHHYLGLRKLYISVLKKLFNFGQEKVEKKRPPRWQSNADELDVSMDDISRPIFTPNHPKALGMDEDAKEDFHLDHILNYVAAGMAAITDDSVTKYFEPEELPQWNLLSRTNKAYEFISFRLTLCWMLGFLIRYLILFPLRLIILLLGFLNLVVCMSAIGLLPDGNFKRWLNSKLMVFCFDFIAGSLSLVATFHDVENAPKKGGIAVANHTSPIDALVLATNHCYDMVGQRHSGPLGVLSSALCRASSHIFFERSEVKERALVMKKLQMHAENPYVPPILIFPEGVCVNNTSVMQFKKGAFEIDTVIYPIAIRFDARFGDAFWWQDKFHHYLLHMMTSWAIVCNVWYLPPMRRKQNESAIAFAARVKAKIAHQGGMIDLSWDGFLKACPVKEEWKKQQQEEFARHLNVNGEEAEEDGACDEILNEFKKERKEMIPDFKKEMEEMKLDFQNEMEDMKPNFENEIEEMKPSFKKEIEEMSPDYKKETGGILPNYKKEKEA
ncbi:glycerol-3-phosphate acyltransferase 3-like [Palaemon carinicauda]|uniref:glycerol-3-phosphate acyltransferase 3-like n=1 Tax=Palaemon carinicauda TaxID=392227 RepID=UPI0035B68132